MIEITSKTQNNYDTSFQLLFDLSVQGIFIEDEHGNILNCNEAGNKMFGYEKGELIGVNISQLVPDEFAAILPKIITDKMVTGDQYLERINKKKDGTIFATEICTKYTIINGSKCLIAFIHDISTQKEIQNELIESRNQYKKLVKNREKFFSIISHDLKSPMQSILGFTDLIDEELTNPSSKIKMYIENLKKSANASYELLENLLQWTICQSNRIKPHFETFDIYPTCENNFSFFNEIALKKNISIEKHISENTVITTDKNMLQYILRNLLINAIKFTPKNGNVSISVNQINGNTCFIVKDTGLGIDPKKIDKILDQNIFYSTSGTENETGTGIGLKICFEFLKLLNSKLQIESKINEGSIFSFNLPSNISVN